MNFVGLSTTVSQWRCDLLAIVARNDDDALEDISDTMPVMPIATEGYHAGTDRPAFEELVESVREALRVACCLGLPEMCEGILRTWRNEDLQDDAYWDVDFIQSLKTDSWRIVLSFTETLQELAGEEEEEE